MHLENPMYDLHGNFVLDLMSLEVAVLFHMDASQHMLLHACPGTPGAVPCFILCQQLLLLDMTDLIII